jgi:hypothetical protein
MNTRTGPTGLFHGGSKSFQRLNPGLVTPAVAAPVAPKRIRQHAGDSMNTWEREWRACVAHCYEHIYREVSLPLANGLRYKVDFLCVDTMGAVYGYEVKGFARSTGIAKLKMAATLYPWIKFVLVSKRTKREGGGWNKEEVLA